MKIAVICFSAKGAALGEKVIRAFSGYGNEMAGYIAKKYAEPVNALSISPAFAPFASVYELVSRLFDSVDAFIFFSACGIAVRAVAPKIKSKLTDPAVVVCDEHGRFSVSLLSGHEGGANWLAEQVSAALQNTSVITTASGYSDETKDDGKPRNLALGVGFRGGVPSGDINRAVHTLLRFAKINPRRVSAMGTIDIKRGDEALARFAEDFGVPVNFYSAGELAAVPGEFSHSGFVYNAVGVGNVCERAAALCGGSGRLILRKASMKGVTIAVFEME